MMRNDIIPVMCSVFPFPRIIDHFGLVMIQRCESFEGVEIDIEYEKNCKRLEKDNCKTEYKEVKFMHRNDFIQVW